MAQQRRTRGQAGDTRTGQPQRSCQIRCVRETIPHSGNVSDLHLPVAGQKDHLPRQAHGEGPAGIMSLNLTHTHTQMKDSSQPASLPPMSQTAPERSKRLQSILIERLKLYGLPTSHPLLLKYPDSYNVSACPFLVSEVPLVS